MRFPLSAPASLLLAAALASAARAQPVLVEINAARVLRTVNPLLYGVNTARWDESLFPAPDSMMLLTCDRDAIRKVKDAGITLLKYPGGNDADSYVWNAPGNNPAEMSTDEYIAFCRETGAEPFITVNFNAGTDLAAAWVRYCRDHAYNVRYWEVGDEQWGTWAKGHAPPEVYAQKYIALVKAMREADPSIKVATNVPLGPHPENWTARVLKAAGEYVDMLTVTYFPQQWGKENDDTLFASTAAYRRLFGELRRDVETALGKERADSILYVNVGYNSVNHSPGPQTVQMANALWTADMLGTMAECGTDIACFWALHNAYPPRKGDYGILSSEGSNTPYSSYYVFPIFTRHFGSRLVETRSRDPLVSAYAALKGKTLTLIVVNKRRTGTGPLVVAITGFACRLRATRWTLSQTDSARESQLQCGSTGGFTVELPPWSVTACEIPAADSVDPPDNLARHAHATASSCSAIGPNYGAASAIDGISYTRWNSAAWTGSNGAETQWLRLTWRNPVPISRVTIRWGESCARSYRIETSDDGLQWTSLAEVAAGKGGVEELRFTPVTAHSLRVVGLQGTKGISAYSIKELEVYAK